MQQTKYPMGPLSLAQIAGFERTIAVRDRGKDVYDVGIKAVAELGCYPTFGHIDGTHRRWYHDLWTGRNEPFGILDVPNHNRGGKLEDIIFRIAIGVKNDALSQEAGSDTLATILQDRIEEAVLKLTWVTDLLTTRDD
jgi:hypothetical protein